MVGLELLSITGINSLTDVPLNDCGLAVFNSQLMYVLCLDNNICDVTVIYFGGCIYLCVILNGFPGPSIDYGR